MTLESDIGCLKSIPLFQSLPPPRLKLLALMGERLRFSAGSVISREGLKPQEVFCVLEGQVEISNPQAGEGHESLSLSTGSMLGDVPLLCGRVSAGRVTAKTDVVVLRLPRELFFELLDSVPEFAMALTRDLACRLYRLAGAVLQREVAARAPQDEAGSAGTPSAETPRGQA